jgi:hypothetical protein
MRARFALLLALALTAWACSQPPPSPSTSTPNTPDAPEPLPAPTGQALFVSSVGADDPAGGAQDRPFKTLAFACARAQSGQTVRLAAGEYFETAACAPKSGVRVSGAGSGQTVVYAPSSWDFRADGVIDNPAGYVFRLEGVQNVTVDGVGLHGNGNRANGGVLVQNASGVTLRDLSVIDFRLAAIAVRASSKVDAQNLYLENSSFEWFKGTQAKFPDGGSFGNLAVSDVQDAVFGFIKIKTTALRGYGIKAASLSRVKFTNLETDLYPFQSWNSTGTPGGGNFSMEIHGGHAELVEISHSRFDGTLSLMGGNDPRYDAVPYTIHVHHNRFDPKGGAYGIEVGTDRMVVDHNWFTGTWTALQNFGGSSTRINDLTVFNNVADKLSMRLVGLAGRVENLRVFGNTVNLGAGGGQSYLVTLASNDLSKRWLIANNAIQGSSANAPNSRQLVVSYVMNGTASSAPRNLRVTNNVVNDIALNVTVNDTPADPTANDLRFLSNLETDPGLPSSGASAYQPTSSSAVVDKGDPNVGVKNTFNGAGRDIGAFELGETPWTVGPGSVSDVRYIWAPTTTLRQTAFVDSVDVPLSAEAGAQIRYTLDGSEPGISSTLYTAPIRVTRPVQLRARAFKDGFGSPTALALDLEQGVQGYPNLSLGQPATASSVYLERDPQGNLIYAPSKAVDGITTGWIGWSPAASGDARPWLQVDLGSSARVRYVRLLTRQQIGDDASARRNFQIQGSNDPSFNTFSVLATQGGSALPFQGEFSAEVTDAGRYRYIRAAKTANESFFITEFTVQGER